MEEKMNKDLQKVEEMGIGQLDKLNKKNLELD